MPASTQPVRTGNRYGLTPWQIEPGDIVTLTEADNPLVRITAVHQRTNDSVAIEGRIVGGQYRDDIGTRVISTIAASGRRRVISAVRGATTQVGDLVTGTCPTMHTTRAGTVAAILPPAPGDSGVRFAILSAGEARAVIVH